MNYQEFLESKIVTVEQTGFKAQADRLHPSHFPHQVDTILWALDLGKALIASSFGLGKTAIQCELARNRSTSAPVSRF